MILPAFLVALFTGVCGFPTDLKEVPPQCSDPTFACQDLPNARLCGVVKSCIHDIWSTMGAPDDNDDICQICKEMVKEARDQLLSNMTQEEIKEVFEGSCKLLPIKLIANGCIKIVDEFIPELVEMLASRMDPNMVCTVSGLCNSAHLPILKQKNPLSFHHRSHNKGCDDCTKLITNIKDFTSDVPQYELLNIIEKAIRSANPNLDTKLVHLHVNTVYVFVTKTMNPKSVCGIAGICPMSCQTFSKPRDDLTCQFCTHVLNHIKDLITTNTTVEEFRRALLNFCNFTGSFADRCTSLVDKYFDTVFDFISHMDSLEVCKLIGVCYNGSCLHQSSPLIKVVPALSASKRIKATKLMPSFPVNNVEDMAFDPIIKIFPPRVPIKKEQNSDEIDSSNEILGSSNSQLPLDRFSHPGIVFENDLECNFCKAISFYLKTDLKSDTSKDSVDRSLSGVCEKWVSQFPEYCHIFLSKHSSELAETLINSADFDNTCSHIKVCPVEEKPGLDVTIVDPTPPSPLCNLCKTTCDEIESKLKDPSTKKNVEQALYQVCNYLPKPLTDDCHTFINDNIDNLFNILEQELDGDNVCPALHLCPEIMHKVPFAHVKDLECDLCKDFVQQLQQKLEDPQVKQYVKAALEKACAVLPQEISSECKDFVDQNIDNLVNLIVQDMDPNLICTALKLCPGSMMVRPKKMGDLECELCKEVVGKLDDELKDHATEEEIKTALDKVCSYFPTSFAAKCQTFVDQYAESLITILAMELDPAMVCGSLKICPASVVVKPKKMGDVECDLCKEVIGKLNDELKDHATEEEIKNALDKVCSYFPASFAAKCQTFVDQYAESLITILAIELDPGMVCGALKICPASVVVKPKKIGNLECDLCKEVVGKLDDELKDHATEEEIKTALDKVCSYFPTSFAAKCQTFVDQYAESLITILAMELDPAMVCGSLKICPASVVVKPKKMGDVECDLCKEVIGKLDDELKDHATEEEIKNALDKVCSYFPTSFAAKCQTFVDQYAESLITILAIELDPGMVCGALKICPASVVVKPKKIGNLECDLCKEVIGKLDDDLKDHATEDEIKNALDKVCSYFPASFAAKCQTFVNKYMESLITILATEMDPAMVCGSIKLCPAEKELLQKWKSKAQDIECEACNYAFHYIQVKLMDNASQDEIKGLFKKMCDILPDVLAENCNAYIDEFGSSLLVLVAQELDPTVMCKKLNACPSVLRPHVQKPNIELEKSLKFDECNLCTTVVDYLDKLLEEDDVDQEITALVEKACSVVPSLKDKCTALVETYGPYILQMIGQLADSKQVCQDIDMCPRVRGHVHLLGGEKCTSGPSYWCQSKLHASACKADMYCKQKVWNK